MTDRNPLISIGVPVYNGANFLGDALDSILAQTLEDFEVVISDNASTDETQNICRTYAARDSRIRYHRQTKNLGAARNYNDTFRRSRGRYFRWTAHDDMIAPTFLERCHSRLEDEPGAAVAYARMREVDQDGSTRRDYDASIVWHGETPKTRVESLLCAPLEGSHIHRCVPMAGLFRANVLRRTRLMGGFNSADKVALLEAALLGDFAEVPEYLFYRRIHAGVSLSANPTPKDLARWYDPAARHWIVTPRSRLFAEYARSIARADIPIRDRLACVAPVLRLLGRDWRVFGGEIKNTLLETLTSSPQVGNEQG